MRYEICGKGFLGKLAFDFFQTQTPNAALFSSKEFQYIDNFNGGTASGSDVLLNVSGPSSIEESFLYPDTYLNFPLAQAQIHLSALSNLSSPPHYVYISSASVYGDCTGFVPDENFPLNPISPYASGKAEVESFLLSKDLRYPGGVTVVRATSVFAEHLSSRVLGRIRSLVTANENLELYGSGDEVRDFIHAKFFFSALHEVVKYNIANKKSDVINLGSGFSLSIARVVDLALASIENCGARTITFNGVKRIGDPHSMIVSIDKLNDLLPWRIPSQERNLKEYFSFKPK